MNNVIGPISKEDFYTINLLRKSLKYMKSCSNREEYSKAIEKETMILNYYMNNLGKAA